MTAHGLLPTDWPSLAPSRLIGSIADELRKRVAALDEGQRFLGALGSAEDDFDDILAWLRGQGTDRRIFLLEEGSRDQAVFFTWVASEWAYFSWATQDRNFWASLGVDILGVEPIAADFPRIYRALHLGFSTLGIANHHLDDSETGWCYIESLRRQSGFPRAWWDCVHAVVQEHGHQQDVAGRWHEILREDGSRRAGFQHAAREFPDELNRFFDAAHETTRRKSPEPLRRLRHAFARQPEDMASYLLSPGSLRNHVEALRSRRIRRRAALALRSARRFWLDSIEIGIAAIELPGRWQIHRAVSLPDRIPTERLPPDVGGVLGLTLAVGGDEVRYQRVDDGFGKPDRPWLFLDDAHERTDLVARFKLADGTRPEFVLLSLAVTEERAATFYQEDLRHAGFYVPLDVVTEDDRLLDVPEGHHALLVTARDEEVACDPEPVAVLDLGDRWAIRVLPPPDPSSMVLVGDNNDPWTLTAKPPVPGELLLEGHRQDECVGEKAFDEWPVLKWRGPSPVGLRDLTIVPAPQASNFRWPRHMCGGPPVLKPGCTLDLGACSFHVKDEAPSPLPREFVGRVALRAWIIYGGDSWRLVRWFKVLPLTEICPGPTETGETWSVPIHVVVQGAETLQLETKWELTTGGRVWEEAGATTGRLGERLMLDVAVPVKGRRLMCRVRYGFRQDLPPDFDPGFAEEFVYPLPGPVGYLVDGSRTARPLGTGTIVRVEELASCSLVLSDGGALLLSGGPRDLPKRETALAHLRGDLVSLLGEQREMPLVWQPRNGSPQPILTLRCDDDRLPVRLQVLVGCERSYPNPDAYREVLAQAVLDDLVHPSADQPSWDPYWTALARIRLRDFGAFHPSLRVARAYEELGRSGTPIVAPWLRRSWGFHRDQTENDIESYRTLSQLVEHLETLSRDHGFAFLPALLAGAQAFGPRGVLPQARDRMCYLVLSLCTGCRSWMQYAARSMRSVPQGPRLREGTAPAPWWVSQPEDLRYHLAWELHGFVPTNSDVQTFRVCRSILIDDPPLSCSDDTAPIDLTCAVLDLDQGLCHGHPARELVRAALACSQEWARSVVRPDAADMAGPLLGAFHLACRRAPALTRALCIDALLHELDRAGEPVPWVASRNDPKDLHFPEFWKHLHVPQVL